MLDQIENTDQLQEDNNSGDSFDETTHEDDVTIEGAEIDEPEEGKTQIQETTKDQQGKEGLTSKGTKLADDPLSRANQLRANAEAKSKEYEMVLNDPVVLERYLKVLKGERTSGENDGKEIKLEEIKTTEDLQKYLAQERVKDRQVIEGIRQHAQGQAALNQYDSDLTAVRKAYPDMTEEQENIIGDLFEAANFDPQRGYVPKVRLADIAKKVMEIATESKKAGSKEAQTIVRNARSGRNVSGTVTQATVDESKMTAEQVIANRFKQAGLRRK